MGEKKKTTTQGHAGEASRIESLPDELIRDILSWVPTFELGNVRCVCKRWRHIVRVEDPLFRILHSSHSMSRPTDNNLLLLKGFDDLCFVDLAASSRDPGEVTNLRTIKTPYIDVPSFSQYDVLGSCNGLLCLGSKKRMEILVMNPFTHQHVRLDMDESGDLCVCAWGFGFESVKKIYKVVVVFWDTLVGAWELSICDLDSEWSLYWRDIGWEGTFNFHLLSESPACFVNGRLHWAQYYDGSDKIVSFDVADEEFRLIPTPDYLRNRKTFDLFVLRDCLCIIRSQPSVTPGLEIWVMKEYGVKESWVKEVDTKPLIPKSLPSHFDKSQKKRRWRLTLEGLGSTPDGKVLLKCKRRESEEAILFSSDPTCDQFQFLEFESAHFYKGSAIHTASLNWI